MPGSLGPGPRHRWSRWARPVSGRSAARSATLPGLRTARGAGRVHEAVGTRVVRREPLATDRALAPGRRDLAHGALGAAAGTGSRDHVSPPPRRSCFAPRGWPRIGCRNCRSVTGRGQRCRRAAGRRTGRHAVRDARYHPYGPAPTPTRHPLRRVPGVPRRGTPAGGRMSSPSVTATAVTLRARSRTRRGPRRSGRRGPDRAPVTGSLTPTDLREHAPDPARWGRRARGMMLP